MKVLVTGAEGFVGPHLVAALDRAGHEAIQTSHDGSVGHRLFLPDENATQRLLEQVVPEAVVNLAAVSAVPAAAKDPENAWRVNVDGVREVARAFASVRPDGVFLQISSGAVYRKAFAGPPIDESHPTIPENSYAWTKVAAESWLRVRALSDLEWPRTIIARPFNHVGPGQGPEFALSGFAQQIAIGERERAAQPDRSPIAIRTGNLEARRDFLDVRDVVGAYVALLESPTAEGVFNICSGESHRIGDLLDRLRAHCPLPTEIISDSDRLRTRDRDGVHASCSRLRSETDWAPQYELQQTLEEILADWRHRVASDVNADAP